MSTSHQVFVLSANDKMAEELYSMLSEMQFGSKIFRRLDDLAAGLDRFDCLAVILDIDSVPMTNRSIRILKDKYPRLSILCTSRQRFHPDLKDALSQDVCACLNSPIDPDELQFWLRSIQGDQRKQETPP